MERLQTINVHTFHTMNKVFLVAICFILGCKFPHIAGPWYNIELEARQVRRFLHEVRDFVVYCNRDTQYLV